MVKDLFVRGFDEKLHARATQIATNDRVTLGSIVTDAIDKYDFSQLSEANLLISSSNFPQ